MEKNFENWEASIPPQDMKAELKAMRRNLRRRNWKIVAISVFLVLAILFSVVKLVIPALEKRYWDPTVCSYLEDVTDTELIIATYSELFGHGKRLMSVDVEKTGFANYSLNTSYVSADRMHRQMDISFRSASLNKGEFHFDLNYDILGSFHRLGSASEYPYKSAMAQVKEKLNTLPEYVQVYASVTFREDLNLHQLQQLQFQYLDSADFIWAVLRSCEPTAEDYIQCGVSLKEYRSNDYSPEYWNSTDYSQLFLQRYDWTGSQMEQHVKSMLRFSGDQLKNGTGILPNGAQSDYYEKTLQYLEENGVKVYGSYVIATPEALLDMMNDGLLLHVHLMDAKIGI